MSLCIKSNCQREQSAAISSIRFLSKIEQPLFQKRTNRPYTERQFSRLALELSSGMKYAYIDCECIYASSSMRHKMVSKTLMAASTRPIILAILSRGEDYGYSIIQKVKDVSGGHLEWTDGMLYPVLQRMEMDDLITSQWKLSRESRPRRYYTITERGRNELASELVSWRNIWKALARLTEPIPAGD
jgi:PadR family transcriptional regulator PadR